MKGKFIPEKGKSKCKIPVVGMSLARSSYSRVGEVADMDENQSRVGLETNIRRLMLFSVSLEIGLQAGELQVLMYAFKRSLRLLCRE